jgi:hypothetical protein
LLLAGLRTLPRWCSSLLLGGAEGKAPPFGKVLCSAAFCSPWYDFMVAA